MDIRRSAVSFVLAVGLLLLAACPEPDPPTGSSVVAEFTSGTAALTLSWGRISNTVERAQSFSVPADSSCARVELYVRELINPFLTGDYDVEIREDNSDEPTGALVASASRFGGGLLAGAWNAWPFGVPVALTGGRTYWIVCRTTELELNHLANLDADGAAGYSYGKAMMSTGGGSWADVPMADLFFRVMK